MWSYATPRFDQHSDGFIKGLRRQYAILQTKLASWLANKMGEGTIIAYWDVSNAFPGICHSALDQGVLDNLPKDVQPFAQHRHQHAMTVMTEASDPNQMICLKFQQGDRQGDSPAPQTFLLAYDRAAENMLTISETFREERAFCWREPLSGKDEMIDRAR
eukprot:5969452-Heterocapsa_arctica.AAC.1